jgi:hypothetical protein
LDASRPLDFTTPNRYKSIAEQDNADQQKQKVCSPKYIELSTKRLDDSSSPNTQATIVHRNFPGKEIPSVSLVNDKMMTDSVCEHVPVITPPAPQIV